jgi:hypothetical protein
MAVPLSHAEGRTINPKGRQERLFSTARNASRMRLHRRGGWQAQLIRESEGNAAQNKICHKSRRDAER